MAAYQVKDFSDIYSMVMEELKLQSTDTTSLNRIKRDINAVYLNEVVSFKRWWWLSGHTQVEHKAYVADGTASVTPDSTAVTLSVAPTTSKTNFFFATDSFNEIFPISAHTASSTSLTLSSAYTGTLAATAAYKIWTDTLALPTDLRETVEVFHNFSPAPLKPVGLQEFRRIVAQNPRKQGRPEYYTTYDFFDPSTGDGESEADRYRVMKIWPAIHDSSTTIRLDYVKEAAALELDGDEPLMPIEDRMVLVYGALARAWARERNEEAAARNIQLFGSKLARMAGNMQDSFDTPQLVPNSRYLAGKRGPRVSKFRNIGFDGGSYSAPSYLKGVRIDGGSITDTITVTAGVTIDGRDISADGATLDTLSALSANIDTPNRAIITNGSSELEESDITSTELAYLDDVEALTNDTLTDNTSSATEIAYWEVASFDSILIDYTLERGSGNKEVGQVMITSDGTSAAIANGNIASIGTLGVSFSTGVSGTRVQWLYTTTSTGTDATLKYKVQKWIG